MNKVEVGTLDENELFEHRGVIYEVLYKTDYCVRCQYPNDKYRYGVYGNISIPSLVYGQKLIKYENTGF
jgi:hypothetical protein